jgi:hypothetical protein
MKTLNEAKFHLISLGVDKTLANSITQEELDIAQNSVKVSAYCHKCDKDHTVPEPWAHKYKKMEDGRLMAKCGECYL